MSLRIRVAEEVVAAERDPALQVVRDAVGVAGVVDEVLLE